MESLVVVLLCVHLVWSIGLREEFTWSRISYVKTTSRYLRPTSINTGYSGIIFPDDSSREYENDVEEDYNYENNIPMGANRWRNKLFVTVPRRRNGIPSTLNFVWINSTERHNVPLIPYPNQRANNLHNDRTLRIVSVYRTSVDPCNRLWMVDTGKLEIPGNASQVQPPSIMVFDLETDKLIRRYVFENDVVKPSSTLADITVDVTESECGNAYAYIPDLSGYGLIVYSFREDRSWRITHNYFYLEPLAGELSIGGFNFQWDDGIFSIALSELNKDGYRTAYFHSMAGYNIYNVSTKTLRDRLLATRSYHGDSFQVVGTREPGYQSSSSSLYQPSGMLFLGLINKNGLGCLNTRRKKMFSNPLEIGIIQSDDARMIYPSDVKVYKNEVIVLTNSMPVFAYGKLDYSKINFRVWMENVDKAVEGTSCR